MLFKHHPVDKSHFSFKVIIAGEGNSIVSRTFFGVVMAIFPTVHLLSCILIMGWIANCDSMYSNTWLLKSDLNATEVGRIAGRHGFTVIEQVGQCSLYHTIAVTRIYKLICLDIDCVH